jgi:hypothetical protein
MSVVHKGQHSSVATEFKSGELHPGYGKPGYWLGKKVPPEIVENRTAKIKKKFANIQLVSPDGTIYTEVIGVKDFALKHGLNNDDLSLLLRGKMKKYKGWYLLSNQDSN